MPRKRVAPIGFGRTALEWYATALETEAARIAAIAAAIETHPTLAKLYRKDAARSKERAASIRKRAPK